MERKLRKAADLCPVARYPATYSALIAHVPASLVQRLTASELAQVVESLDACAKRSKELAAQEIVNEGCVWDARNQRMIDLA